MTRAEKYNLLLEEIAEIIKSKNNTILLQKSRIEDLEAKLQAAKKE